MERDPHEQLQGINLSPYEGEWVAIYNSKVIAHGWQVKDVFADAKQKQPHQVPHLLKVPGKETWVFITWS